MNKVEGVVNSISDLVITSHAVEDRGGGQGTPTSDSDDNGVIILGEGNSSDDNDDCSNDLKNVMPERQPLQQGTALPPQLHGKDGIFCRPEPRQEQQQQQQRQEEQQREQEEAEEQEAQPAQGVTESVFPHNQLKVLLVEDDYSTRHVVAALLRNCGYEVTAAASGAQAWEIVERRESSVDLVLTDLMMPGLSGLELLKKIIRRETSKRIPVVMMSSLDSMDVVLKCLSEGAVDFLVKPVRKNELKNLWQHFWRMCLSSTGSGSGSPAGNNSGSYGGLNVGDGSDNGSGTQSSWNKKPVEVQSHEEAGDAHAQPELPLKRDKRDVEESGIINVKNKVESRNHASTSNAEPSCKDLLGRIQNHAVDRDSGKAVPDNNDSTLELSLKRSRLKEVEVEDVVASEGEQKFILHQSGGSAFSRYSNNPLQLPPNNTNPNTTTNTNTNNTTTNNNSSFPMNLWLNVGGNAATGERGGGGGDSRLDMVKVPADAALSHFKVAASNFAAFSDIAAAYAQSLHQFFYHGTPPVPPWPQPGAPPPPPEFQRGEELPASHTHHQQHHHHHRPVEDELTVNNNTTTNHNSGSHNNNNNITLNHNNNNNDNNNNSNNNKVTVNTNNITNTTKPNNTNVAMSQRVGGMQHCISSTGKVAEASNGSSNANGNGQGNGSVNGSVSGSNNVSNNNMHNGHSNGHSGVGCTAGNGDSGNNGSSKGNATGITFAGNGNEAGILPCPDNNNNTQLTRREVALYKFRQKRKERCFEKKVRYQSRKRLAEQRPRVRGQFVKQIALTAAAEQAGGLQGDDDSAAMEVDGEFEGDENIADCA